LCAAFSRFKLFFFVANPARLRRVAKPLHDSAHDIRRRGQLDRLARRCSNAEVIEHQGHVVRELPTEALEGQVLAHGRDLRRAGFAVAERRQLAVVFYVAMAVALITAVAGSPGWALLLLVLGSCALARTTTEAVISQA
jgi:Flp pilus assembly protein TadB